jgi:hypothetical protein
MINMRETKKTKCGHRFHKECLHTWCDSRKQQGVETLCPFCNKNIEKDCASLLPGKFMPDNRIEDILKSEDLVANILDERSDEVMERKRRKKEFLEKLRFPRNYSTVDWTKITNFRMACDKAINFEEVKEEFAKKYDI